MADRGVGGAGVADSVDRQGDRSAAYAVAEHLRVMRRPPAPRAAAVAVAVVVDRAGGDLAGSGRRRVTAGDRASVGSVAVDDRRGRSRRMAAGVGIERVARTRPRCGGCGDRSRRSWRRVQRLRAVVEAKARVALVPAADLGLAGGGVPRRSGDARVARDDLPVVVRAVPRRVTQGTDPLFAFGAHDPPAARPHRDERSRPAARHAQHLANGPPKPTTERCPAIGKATCSWANGCTRWRRWWNARPASSC